MLMNGYMIIIIVHVMLIRMLMTMTRVNGVIMFRVMFIVMIIVMLW